ncbi:hypothetical protein C8R43DRAFT_1119695 [Mycena crocata]|nr:hypothetical protein C8R43DRAFT_1119695 [Mycena crocata]
MQYLARAAVMGWCLRSGFFAASANVPLRPSKQCIPPNLGVLKIRDRRAAAAITTPPRNGGSAVCTRTQGRIEGQPLLRPPRSGGGNDYPTYRNPASGGQIPFFLPPEANTPAMTSKYRISPTASISRPPSEPPRRGGGSSYATYRNPASGLKFEFLPPEANTPLRLQSTVFPQTPESLPRTCEPPRSGGGNNYTMYRNPASGVKFGLRPHLDLNFDLMAPAPFQIFLPPRPTPRHDFKATYVPK